MRKHPDKIRLFLRHEKDKIYVAGRKTGKFNFMCTREACRGKYIALLEGDDFWIDNLKLQKQADYLEQNPECIFVVGRTLRLNMQTGESKMAPSLKKVGVMNFSHVLNGIVGHTSTICFRNGTMNHRDPTYTQAINGDWLTELILLENGGVFYVDKSVMSVYRITGTGIWTAIDLKKQIHSNFDTLLAYEPRVPAQWRKQFLQVKMEYEWLKIKQAGLLRNIPAIFSLFKRYPQFALAIPSRAVRSISSKLRRIFDISNNE